MCLICLYEFTHLDGIIMGSVMFVQMFEIQHMYYVLLIDE